jgi:hypothetical protein
MSIEDKMNIDERRKYLFKMQRRYRKADRKEKGRLLDEMETITGMDRKYLVRLISGDLRRQARAQQRGRVYGPEVDDALRVIDESYDYICAERLTPNLVWMTQHLARHGEIVLTDELVAKMAQISVSTVGRIQSRIRQDQPRRPRRRRGRSRNLTQGIPMRKIPWDVRIPGRFETDLVYHSGPDASGEFMCTLQVIDVATGWSERFAVLGRSYLVMKHAFLVILRRLPFPVIEIHPDNGSEFLNYHMIRFWGDIVQGVELSRSRPFHKNDNRNVEQKNFTLVRAYLGDDRLDSVAQVLAANEIYHKMGVYYNLFQPVMHLTEKQTIYEDGQPVHVKRRYDEARTPFDRLCKTDAILPEHQQQLETLRDRINPRRLIQGIYDDIERLFALPGAVPGVTENVYRTLEQNLDSEKGDDDLFNFAFNRTPIRDEDELGSS